MSAVRRIVGYRFIKIVRGIVLIDCDFAQKSCQKIVRVDGEKQIAILTGSVYDKCTNFLSGAKTKK